MEVWVALDSDALITSNFERVALTELLRLRRGQIAGSTAFADRKPITVHLDGTVSVRAREKAYQGGMFAVEPGDVVFSKIDARNGAISVLPNAIGPAVVTSEFPVFTPRRERVDTRFLELSFRSGGFIEAVRVRSSGTTGRKRVTPEGFASLQIPLPTLAEQQALVAAHDVALTEAETLDSETARVEREGVDEFAAALGLVVPPPLPERPMFVARFADLDRWGHEAALRRTVGEAEAEAAYPIVRLGEVIADLENGWSPQCLDRPAGPDEWGVLKVSAASSGRYREDQNKALPSSLRPRPTIEVKPDDVLITRASGVASLVGVAAYVSKTRKHLLLCDKLFRVVQVQEHVADSKFLCLVLNLPTVRKQVFGEFSTESAMMKNISKPALLGLTFPLPPLDVQRALVTAVDAARETAARLRGDAATKRADAKRAFEGALYGDQ